MKKLMIATLVMLLFGASCNQPVRPGLEQLPMVSKAQNEQFMEFFAKIEKKKMAKAICISVSENDSMLLLSDVPCLDKDARFSAYEFKNRTLILEGIANPENYFNKDWLDVSRKDRGELDLWCDPSLSIKYEPDFAVIRAH